MAQTWRAQAERKRRPRPPLDGEGLERLALFYAGRYATTRAKLEAYLARKLKERGWAGPGDPPLRGLAERFTELGYVDDEAFAASRAASLGRRGYGERRVAEALRAAGVGEAEAGPALSGRGRTPGPRRCVSPSASGSGLMPRSLPIARRGTRGRRRCCGPATRSISSGASSMPRRGTFPTRTSYKNTSGRFPFAQKP